MPLQSSARPPMHARGLAPVIAVLLWTVQPQAVTAQGILISTEPFYDSPRLPFAPAAPGARVAMVPLIPPLVYRLRTGEPIHTELQRWAEHDGWEFRWYPDKSWKTLRETVIGKTDVADAVSEVIDILRGEGKPVQLRISDGNQVMEVLSTEVRND
jgi:hypothetical protein